MNSGELNGLALRPEMLAGLNADGTTGGNESSLSGTYRADALVNMATRHGCAEGGCRSALQRVCAALADSTH